MTPQDRAWDCAIVLLDHANRLTAEQHILCVTTAMSHPDRAPLDVIALAALVLGSRT